MDEIGNGQNFRNTTIETFTCVIQLFFSEIGVWPYKE